MPKNLDSIESLFGIEKPIIGLTGLGWTTPKLVAAISNAGAMGVLPVGLMAEAQIEQAVGEVRKLTDKPFAVSMFPAKEALLDAQKQRMQDAALSPLREDLGLTPVRPTILPDFDTQFRKVLELKVPAIGLTLGGLREPYMEELENKGVKTFGVASNLKDAKVLVSSGVQAVVASGWSAGGLLSYCETTPEGSAIDSSVLVCECVRALPIPVIAGGSLMTESQIKATQILGASGIAVSDGFLFAQEGILPESWKVKLSYTSDSATEMSSNSAGRACRTLNNGLSRTITDNKLPVLDFPYQFFALNDIYKKALETERIDLAFLDIGQLAHLAKSATVSEIVEQYSQWLKG